MNWELLLRLLTAHFIADFIFQPNDWVREKATRKINSKYLYLHTVIIFILTFLAALSFSLLWIVLLITVSHFLIDLGKSFTGKDTPAIFILDQLLHIIIIFVCWLSYTGSFSRLENDFVILFGYTKVWLYVVVYIFVTMPTSVLISKFTSRWWRDIDEQGNSLKDAGKWIGIIERVLVVTFIVLDQYEAIGFLLAAKSVFRFGELKNSEERKRAEYILIGTLTSFSIAILAGIILNSVCR